MPRIIRQKLDQRYLETAKGTTEHGDRNDCSVKALSILCDIPYAEAHRHCAPYRKRGHGMWTSDLLRVINRLGFRDVSVDERHFMDRYPGRHGEVLKNVSTHHPERFHKVWRDGHKYLLVTANHFAAVVDGHCVDWSTNKALRVKRIYRIEKVAA